MTDQEYRQHLIVLAIVETCFSNLNSDSSEELDDILEEINTEVSDRLMVHHGLTEEQLNFGYPSEINER